MRARRGRAPLPAVRHGATRWRTRRRRPAASPADLPRPRRTGRAHQRDRRHRDAPWPTTPGNRRRRRCRRQPRSPPRRTSRPGRSRAGSTQPTRPSRARPRRPRPREPSPRRHWRRRDRAATCGCVLSPPMSPDRRRGRRRPTASRPRCRRRSDQRRCSAASTSERAANSSSPPRRAWNATANGSDRRRAVIARATSRCTSARRGLVIEASTPARINSWRNLNPASLSTSNPAVAAPFEIVEHTDGRRTLHRCQEIDVDLGTDRGGGSDGRTGVAQRRELSINRVADRRRDIVVGQRGDHRVEQQRVPAAALVQSVRPFLARELARRRQIERAERQHDLVGDAGTASTPRHDDQQATCTVDRPPQPGQRRRLREVVEVLDDEHRGARTGEHLECPQHRPEQLTLTALGTGRHRRRGGRMPDPDRRRPASPPRRTSTRRAHRARPCARPPRPRRRRRPVGGRGPARRIGPRRRTPGCGRGCSAMS